MGTTIKVITVMCIALWSCISLTQSAPETALITKLPNFKGNLPSKHYAGYVTLGSKKVFYYFVESENMPSKDPVVLWLNGGPGCSSFDGFVYEHGPFNFEKGATPKDMPTLHVNPYSWAKVANMIYLDSPVAVGFSFSQNSSDYVTGDTRTALDSHAFLLNWFGLYPEFVANPFYISGESYAGTYVPTLAFEVVKGIRAGVKPVLNFKGYTVNGIGDPWFDGNAHVPFAHGMGLISDDLYAELVSNCDGNYYNSTNKNCDSSKEKVNEVTQGVNLYDILEPCFYSNKTNPIKMTTGDSKLPPSFRKLGETERPMPVRNTIFGPLQVKVSTPCIAAVSGPWQLCTDRINFTREGRSMIEYHRNMTSLGYRALIYSGDHDMAVPFTGTEAWVKAIGHKIVDEWRPWLVGVQVDGYIQGYDKNLTFLTIKGSGHMVPENKPQEALEFYTRWLAGKKIQIFMQ